MNEAFEPAGRVTLSDEEALQVRRCIAVAGAPSTFQDRSSVAQQTGIPHAALASRAVELGLEIALPEGTQQAVVGLGEVPILLWLEDGWRAAWYPAASGLAAAGAFLGFGPVEEHPVATGDPLLIRVSAGDDVADFGLPLDEFAADVVAGATVYAIGPSQDGEEVLTFARRWVTRSDGTIWSLPPTLVHDEAVAETFEAVQVSEATRWRELLQVVERAGLQGVEEQLVPGPIAPGSSSSSR